MDSYRVVLADRGTLLLGLGSTMAFVVPVACYCLQQNLPNIRLAFLNVVGSVVWTVLYIIFLCAPDAQTQAQICSFYGLSIAYYLTELLLFCNRISCFYELEPGVRRLSRIMGRTAVISSIGAVIIDFTLVTELGTIAWNGAEMGVYCSGSPPLYNYPFFALYCITCSIVFSLALKAIIRYMKAADPEMEKNFQILKLMFVSFVSTLVSASLNSANILVPYKRLNFYIDHLLAILTPIDTVVSLCLSILVLRKIQLKKVTPRAPPKQALTVGGYMFTTNNVLPKSTTSIS